MALHLSRIVIDVRNDVAIHENFYFCLNDDEMGKVGAYFAEKLMKPAYCCIFSGFLPFCLEIKLHRFRRIILKV